MNANLGRSEELCLRIFLDLYTKGKQTAVELAARYDVSQRTIYRKVAILSCILPIIVETGRYGGIRLMEGFELRGVVYG